MLKYAEVDQIVSTTHNTIGKLGTYKNGGDALLLYFRYILQRKMQENVRTRSKDIFMMKAMGWHKDKFYKVKHILVENWLIKMVRDKNNEWYVQVMFIISESWKSGVSPENQEWVLENGTPENADSWKSDTNTPIVKVNTPIVKVNSSTNVEGANLDSSFWEEPTGSNTPQPPSSKRTLKIGKKQIDKGKVIRDIIKKFSPVVDGKIEDCYYLYKKIENAGFDDPPAFLHYLIQAMIDSGKSVYYSYANPSKLSDNLWTIISSISTSAYIKKSQKWTQTSNLEIV